MTSVEFSLARDTIAAIATAAGHGGVGIVRLSGPRAASIAHAMCGRALEVRRAQHVRFRDEAGATIDDGIALRFMAPASYTGEDVVELQAHGSPAVLRALLARCVALGARHARAGEFSERAFLEGRLDLAQAEAVADLIAASDLRAARAARRALDGEFSHRVDAIAEGLLQVRVHVEAAIDFVDEPIETLGGAQLHARIAALSDELVALRAAAERGRRLRDGLHAVIVGPPNAGKSSLLNALAGRERAIVTDVAGTTRDVLEETVRVDGVELTLVDTAGLREGGDAIEREGMRRAHVELQRADLAIIVLDARAPETGAAAVADAIVDVPQRLWVHNKADLLEDGAHVDADSDAAGSAAVAAAHTAGVRDTQLRVSARTGDGLDRLHAQLAALATGGDAAEGTFTARARHVDALHRASEALGDARAQLDAQMLDLCAEALRHAHDALGEITGRVRADDLLGAIFSSFCIGK